MLAVSGVDSGFAASRRRPSTLAFARKVADETEYDIFDEGSAGRMLTDTELPAFPKIVTALHFGSFSLAEEPCGSAFEMLMQREQRDRVISLDPNIRPTLIRNREGYLARIERLVAMSDVVKLSQGDLAWLAPEADFGDVAERWLAKGSRLVVLTKGGAGAEARTRIASASVEAGRTKVVDTIGAGDVFTAGMLAHLHGGGRLTKDGLARLTSGEIEEMLRYAAKAALLSVGRAGADPPWRQEVA
jgi:fructokinase